MKLRPRSYSAPLNSMCVDNLMDIDSFLVSSTDKELAVIDLKKPSKIVKCTTILCGIGVGLAMLPIFNKEVQHLDKYGLDVHVSKLSFVLSTINTMLVMSSYAGCYLYKRSVQRLNIEESDNTNSSCAKNTLKNTAKIISLFASIMPIYLLWNIELTDQKAEGSSGFDKFIAWASVSTSPLLCFRTIHAYDKVEKYINKYFRPSDNDDSNDDLTVGASVVVYVTSLIALFSRGLTLYSIVKEGMKGIADNELAQDVSAIAIGAVLANGVCALSEFSKMKKLFVMQRNTDVNNTEMFCKYLMFLVCAIEGGWFSLPSIGKGLECLETDNGLIQAGLFFPMFVSHTILEGSGLYNALMPEADYCEYVQEDQGLELSGDNALEQNE